MEKSAKVQRRGRPKTDPNAPPPPTLSIEAGSKRYRVGRNQLGEAVRLGQVPTIKINGRDRIVTSKCDALFGLTTTANKE
jgi:hypothetical protein